MKARRVLSRYEWLYRRELLESVLPFWARHSLDRRCGGFFTCLDRVGQVYGTDKPVWIMGRATWLYATLYRTVEARPDWLALARHGYEFLTRYCFDSRGKMYFLVTRDGRPLRMRRYYYSEVFGVLALAALAQVTGDDLVRRRAVGLFQTLVKADKVPPAVSALTGIEPPHLIDAPSADSAVAELARFVGDLPIMGQNLGFDLGVLHKIDPHAFQGQKLEILQLAHITYPRSTTRNLGALAQQLGIAVEQEHLFG